MPLESCAFKGTGVSVEQCLLELCPPFMIFGQLISNSPQCFHERMIVELSCSASSDFVFGFNHFHNCWIIFLLVQICFSFGFDPLKIGFLRGRKLGIPGKGKYPSLKHPVYDPPNMCVRVPETLMGVTETHMCV